MFHFLIDTEQTSGYGGLLNCVDSHLWHLPMALFGGALESSKLLQNHITVVEWQQRLFNQI